MNHKVLSEFDIENLGNTDEEVLEHCVNLEIEYYDSEEEYKEAIYPILAPEKPIEIVAVEMVSKKNAVLHMKEDGISKQMEILFPKGVDRFVDFRIPAMYGGNSILNNVIFGHSFKG